LCGIELELLLFDAGNRDLVRNYELVEDILHGLPRNIWRDWYPYQLELKTKPADKPKDAIKEMKELYRTSTDAFKEHDIYVIPATSISTNDCMYCGLHTHISYPNETREVFFDRAMGIYPYILSLADHCKNFETTELNTSNRLRNSHHIRLPQLNKERFYSTRIPNSDRKYRDIIYSPRIREGESENERARMIKPDTMEIRMLDTPSLFSFFVYQIETIYNLASRIKDNNPLVQMLSSNYNKTESALRMSRELAIHQRYGMNKIFRMSNFGVCELLSEYFNITFPNQTQFEFREEKGLSANTNGFICMAIEGGWL